MYMVSNACIVLLSSSLSLMHMSIYVVYSVLLPSLLCLLATVRYKILEGENFGEFGKLKEICQNFLVQIFPLKSLATQYSAAYERRESR